MHSLWINISNSIKNPDRSSKVKQTLTLSTVSFTNTALNTLLQILIVRMFSMDQVAVYMQSVMVYNTMFPFLQMGIDNGIFYLLTRAENKQKEIISNAMIIILVACAFVGMFFLAGGNYFLADKFHNNDIVFTSYLLIPYFCVTVPESIVSVCMIFYKRIRFIAYYNVFKTLTCVAMMLCISFFTSQGVVLFAFRSLISIFMAGLCIIVAFKYVIPRGRCAFNYEITKKILTVSVPLCVSVIAGVMSGNLDKWMVSTLLSPEQFAIFQVGAYELPFIGMITGAISTVMLVDINNAAKRNNISEVISIFNNIAKKTSMLLMPIMIFFIFAGEDFIIFLFTDRYSESVPIFLVYLLYIPIRCVIYGPVFIALGKAKIIMYREIMTLILNAIVSYVAIYYMGAIGAALATVIVTYLYSVPCNLYLLSKWSQKKWYEILPMHCMVRDVIYFLPAGIIVELLKGFFLKNEMYVVKLIAMAIVYGCLILVVYRVVYGLTPRKIISMVKG